MTRVRSLVATNQVRMFGLIANALEQRKIESLRPNFVSISSFVPREKVSL